MPFRTFVVHAPMKFQVSSARRRSLILLESQFRRRGSTLSVKDWTKVASKTYKAGDGTIVSVHAYQNITTGQIVEMKQPWPYR